MIRQSRNGGGLENRRKRVTERPATGSHESEPADAFVDDEIDPADFFDPEEFGILRRGFNASHP